MRKIYKDIFGFEGLYRISNVGDVFSIRNNKLLAIQIGKRGYKYVNLSKGGVSKNFYVHRLVAETFLEKLTNNLVVNHKDLNQLNNNVLNLEWITQSDNIIHALKTRNKDYIESPGEINKYEYNCVISQYSSDGILLNTFNSATEAALKTNCNRLNIAKCLNGGSFRKNNSIKRKWCPAYQHGGFVWKKG